MGDQTLSLPLQHLVVRKVDISAIRELLLRPGAPVADLIVDFWSEYTRKGSYAAQQP
jgi:hypothetical protein